MMKRPGGDDHGLVDINEDCKAGGGLYADTGPNTQRLILDNANSPPQPLVTARQGSRRRRTMLIEATEGAGAEVEGRARRALLDLYEQTMGQPERWVLVDVLRRRL